MLKVALIDDGVYINDSKPQYIEKALELAEDNTTICEQIMQPPLGNHGSICAAIIHKYSANATIYSIKILDSMRLTTNIQKLINAFKWCLQNNIKIINLSLGSTSCRDFYQIKVWVDILKKNGIIIIASMSNDYEYTYPAALDNVIGVCAFKGLIPGKIRIFNDGILGINIMVCPERIVEINREKWKIDYCNSFAAPIVTGKVCEMVAKGKINLVNALLNIRHNPRILRRVENKILCFSLKKHSTIYKSHKSLDVPIINFEGTYSEIKKFSFMFWKDNYFSIVIDQTEDRYCNNIEMIRKISYITKCDLVIGWYMCCQDYIDVNIKKERDVYTVCYNLGNIIRVNSVEALYAEVLRVLV